MDFRSIPSCSEVSCWSPEALIEYFRAHNLRDCEKLVKKQGITGKRFLEMTENEIQKFPKVAVPMLIKIQQHMNKKDEKRALCLNKCNLSYLLILLEFIPEDKEFSDSDSFEEDYESPNEFDDDDYERPASENEEDENENGDYEPPPPNIEDAHPPIFQLKPNVTNSPYADREFGNSTKNPPEPPKRPGNPGLPPNRGHTFPGYSPSSNQENRANTLGPSIDRTIKPSFEMTYPPNVGRGKPPIPGKWLLLNIYVCFSQQASEKLSNLIKPPVPIERNNQPFERRIPSPRPSLPMDKRFNVSTPKRQVPPPGGLGFSSNTFPPRPSAKNSFPGLPFCELCSMVIFLVLLGNMNRSFSEGTCNGRPPAPIPTSYNQTSATEKESLSQDQWYTGNISRSEAETALRSINQDGTFLVRNSSKSTASHPYVLMVLYRNKVYNIQIRQDQTNGLYMLGTGLRGQETFTSVEEIIDYFHKTPLLLIDGKDQSSRQHCMLTFAAGCCLT
uniref:Lymphocyte cytosolic protein 2 n=1 Tax=Xenopus tropicalis TaxID=8364 RepID=A0A6I8R9C6_XENTR